MPFTASFCIWRAALSNREHPPLASALIAIRQLSQCAANAVSFCEPASGYEMKLSITELDQLLAYCEERERAGWYYGDKGMFEHRHARIKRWLTQQLPTARQPQPKQARTGCSTP
jgi:hypothetical protein